jgi:catechol 2,3-dioxygenase-like lactoylglutathione lyase family enzyme
MYITSLHSHSLQVPDLAVAASFYADFGLEVGDRGGIGSVSCSGRDQEQIVLREGPEKHLQAVTFTVRAGSLDELRTRLTAEGHPQVEGLPGRGEGLWVRDPDGLLVQLVEAEPAGYRSYPQVAFNLGDRQERVDQARWLQLSTPSPRRLGHVIKFTPDLAATERFYLQVLGLKLSDRVEGMLSFWNTGLGGDHHTFGAIRSSHPGIHHSSWEVADFDEMGMGAQKMAQCGYTLQWGLGRHTFGSNLFNYVQDPWGSWIEYFSEMDRITPDWEGKTWEAPPAIWGPALPPEFLVNAETPVDASASTG